MRSGLSVRSRLLLERGFGPLALGVLVLRVATVEPPRPIIVRVDEVDRAEAVAYEAATAQADPLDPTTK